MSIKSILKFVSAVGLVVFFLLLIPPIGTPVLDIKPYLPYADSLPHATTGYAPPPQRFIEHVTWTAQAQQALLQLSQHPSQDRMLITELLQQDPRPGYQQTEPERIYGMQLKVGNVRWRVLPQGAEVIDIEPPL